MKKISLLISICILSYSFLETRQNNFLTEGQSIFPCFDRDGKFIFLFEKKEKGIFIGEQVTPNLDNAFQEKLLIKGNVSSPILKKDREERMWVAWEKRDFNCSDIYFACLEDDHLMHQENVSGGFAGQNSSPSFDFDLNGKAWVTWINNSGESSLVVVKDVEERQMWVISSTPLHSAYTPKIIIDKTNIVWAFWVGHKKGQNEIFCSSFNGYEWSENLSLNKEFLYPHLTPEVCLDAEGFPWVVWSAYDGHDYEIWYSSWDGFRWSDESRITDNEGTSDIFPFITFLSNNAPLVTWSRVDDESHIFLKYKQGENWTTEIKISSKGGLNRNPRMAILHNNFGIVWENYSKNKSKLNVRVFSFFQLMQQNGQRNFQISLEPLLPIAQTDSMYPNPELDEKEYIAFGDSITFGVLSRTWFPDKGYVPRLETLMKRRFGSIKVLNRGVPGEQTLEGLARLQTVLQKDKSKYILLMEGTNDMTGGIPSETAAFNAEEMVKKCIQFGVYPLVATIIPRSDSLWNIIRSRTLKFNKIVRDIPPTFSLPLVDQYKVFTTHPDGYFALFSDGAHPNELGYQVMAEAWFKEIKRIPFPPVDLKAERKINKLLFFEEHVNVITWKTNPNLASATQLSQYHIHRKKEGESDKDFAIIGAVPSDTFLYIDRNINPAHIYNYSIQSEDADGVRGPVSLPVRDR
jgi:lysophospholipase L1-like esterase